MNIPMKDNGGARLAIIEGKTIIMLDTEGLNTLKTLRNNCNAAVPKSKEYEDALSAYQTEADRLFGAKVPAYLPDDFTDDKLAISAKALIAHEMQHYNYF